MKIANLLGNMILFIPTGFLLPIANIKLNKYWATATIGVLVVLFVESTQFFIGRTADIDDVIINFIGISIGYFIFSLFKKLILSRKINELASSK